MLSFNLMSAVHGTLSQYRLIFHNAIIVRAKKSILHIVVNSVGRNELNKIDL